MMGQWKVVHPLKIVVKATDRSGSPMKVTVKLYQQQFYILAEFRLDNGDGIEFKRRFQAIKVIYKIYCFCVLACDKIIIINMAAMSHHLNIITFPAVTI